MGLSQLFVQFDKATVLTRSLEDSGSQVYSFRRGHYELNSLTKNQRVVSTHTACVTEEEMEAFENSADGENIYPFYKVSNNTVNREVLTYNEAYLSSSAYNTFYCNLTEGVLDLKGNFDLLHKIFYFQDEDIYGNVNDEEGLIITDYVADFIIQNYNDYNSYEDIVGNEIAYGFNISAIINTR